MLRAGATRRVLGHRVMAPSTLGTFLRAFTFGHVRQLDAVIGRGAPPRPGRSGPGRATERLVVDVDSTICEVDGKKKQGAAYGYTKVLGYHPILATRADTGEILHARMRKGSANTQRGTKRFVEELVARVRRAGASGEIVMRFDSGFWSNDTIATLGRLGVSLHDGRAHRQQGRGQGHRRRSTRRLGRASTTPTAARPRWPRPPTRARASSCAAPASSAPRPRLWPDWRHFAFLTDLERRRRRRRRLPPRARHRRTRHPRPEGGAGMEHCPSGEFFANAAWLCCAVLAHNLIRWTAALGDLVEDDDTLAVARTLRTRYFALPGPPRQPSGTPDPAHADALALGAAFHRRPRQRARRRFAPT